MKKIILKILFLLCTVNIFAKTNLDLDYECPEIETENYYFIDISEYENKKISSIEILYNANNENKFIVFGNNPENKEWEELAQIKIEGFSDKSRGTFSNKNSSNWRYFYITSDSNRVYGYKTSISGKILKCEIREKDDDFEKEPMPKINIDGAYVFAIFEYGAEDYVVFQNYTELKGLKIIPYYFDQKTYKWVRSFEIAILKGFSDTHKIEITEDDGIEDINYIAIEIEQKNNYSFRLYENHSDLYITVSDYKQNDINDVNN